MRVDIFVRDRKPYTFENYAATQIGHSFQALGILFRKIVISDGVFQDYLSLINEDAPDWTLSFDDFLCFKKPFCDLLKIPNFFWRNGSLSYAMHYFDSEYGVVGCTDRRVSEHFSHPFSPHPVNPKSEITATKRIFDVVIFASLIDVESKKQTWKTLFSEKGNAYLHDALMYSKENPHIHPAIGCLAFKNEEIGLNDLVFEVEEYLQAEKTLDLIESLENVRVDVFGEHVGNNWLLRLKNRENVFLHAPLPFTEYFEVLKLSKILVQSFPSFSEACNEWTLSALSLGCLVLTNPNSYLEDLLQNSDFFYRNFGDLNEKIKRYLRDPTFIKPPSQTQNPWKERMGEIVKLMKERR